MRAFFPFLIGEEAHLSTAQRQVWSCGRATGTWGQVVCLQVNPGSLGEDWGRGFGGGSPVVGISSV